MTKVPEFKALFGQAATRVREMTVKAVGIRDPIEQTVFVVYVAMELGTPYNSFEKGIIYDI